MNRMAKRLQVTGVFLLALTLSGCAQLGGEISSSSEPVAETRWESLGTISDDDVVASIWDGKQYVALTATGDVMVSEDASEWTLRSNVAGAKLTDIAYSGGVYVLTGDKLYTSTNLRRWRANLATITYNLNAIIAVGDTFWAVGDKGKIIYSSDGHSWIPSPSTTSENLNAIAGSQGNMTAVGENGLILMNQGSLWVTAREAKKGQPHFYGVTYGGDRFVTVGANGMMWSTASGSASWTQQTSGSDSWLLDVIYLEVAGQYVAVGTNGTALVSDDGSSWTAQTVSSSVDLWTVSSSDGQNIYALGENGTIITRAAGFAAES